MAEILRAPNFGGSQHTTDRLGAAWHVGLLCDPCVKDRKVSGRKADANGCRPNFGATGFSFSRYCVAHNFC